MQNLALHWKVLLHTGLLFAGVFAYFWIRFSKQGPLKFWAYVRSSGVIIQEAVAAGGISLLLFGPVAPQVFVLAL